MTSADPHRLLELLDKQIANGERELAHLRSMFEPGQGIGGAPVLEQMLSSKSAQIDRWRALRQEACPDR